MASNAITQFNRQRSPEALDRLMREKPLVAAQWLQQQLWRSATPDGFSKVQDKLGDILGGDHKQSVRKREAQKLLAQNRDKILHLVARSRDIDAASAVDLGWGLPAPATVTLTGVVRKGKNDMVVLDTPKGAYTLLDRRDGNGDWFIASSDISTFNGRTVTVRALPLEGEDKKALKELHIRRAVVPLEWCPGNVTNFISGRVVVEDGKVGFRRSATEFIEATHAATRATLRHWQKVGLIIPDAEVVQDGKRLTWNGALPEVVHVLVSLFSNGAEKQPERHGKDTVYTEAITPSPKRSDSPTLILGPKAQSKVEYVRRFLAAQIIDYPGFKNPPHGEPHRALRMFKAWGPCDATWVQPPLPSNSLRFDKVEPTL